MEKISLADFKEIELWMYRNARPIELAIWQYCFESGKKETILKLLSLYQNDDGGFGNALEADLWNPNSTPYTTLWAINILKKIEFPDSNHPVMKGLFEYLRKGYHCSEIGWAFSIPSNGDYAHAPWWLYDEEGNKIQNIGITAEICAFLVNHAEEGSDLYTKATTFTNKLISKLGKMNNYGELGINGYIVLLESLEKTCLIDHFDLKSIKNTIAQLIHNSIEFDSSKWGEYSIRPSKYIRSPENAFFKENEEIISIELDYLIKTRQKQGEWNITWSWFDNNTKFPKEFAISENWWKASIAIQNIELLRNFNRIDKGVL
jgi:hypothetical protein